MNQNLTFVLICSTNDSHVEKTLESLKSIAHVLLIDGGPRKNSVSKISEISLVEIARRYSCEYQKRNFTYAAEQYNFGISNVRTEWVFIIDSDETLSETLSKWLCEDNFNGLADFYYVKRYNHFLGKKIRFGQFRPDWNIRLFRSENCRYENRTVHARMITKGKGAKAEGFLNHFTVQNLDTFFSKMIEFSALELEARKTPNYSTEMKARIRTTMLRFPFQATLRFAYSYIFRLGFLDGHLGFKLAKCASFYEDMIDIRRLTSND